MTIRRFLLNVAFAAAATVGLTIGTSTALCAPDEHAPAATPAATAPAAGHDHADHGHDGHDHAHGDHDHAHEEVGAMPTLKQGLWTGITAMLVFIIVAAFLGAFVWPKINQGLDDRANKIRNEIESAEMAQQQAKSALEQYQKNLEEARAEAQRMLDQAKTQQQAIVTELKAKADVELNAMRDKARRDIETAKRAALNEIYAEASTLATSIAGKILQRELGPQDQQRLVEQSLNEMRQVARA